MGAKVHYFRSSYSLILLYIYIYYFITILIARFSSFFPPFLLSIFGLLCLYCSLILHVNIIYFYLFLVKMNILFIVFRHSLILYYLFFLVLFFCPLLKNLLFNSRPEF